MGVNVQNRVEPTRHRRRTGRVVWLRFLLVLTPALLAIVGIAVGALTGAVPVALALEGQQTLRISAARISTEGFGTFPSFVQDPDGTRRPVVVVDLRRIRVTGLCASTSVSTPVGTYVLRATTPADQEVRAGSFQLALQSIDGIDALGQRIGINRERTAPDGTPIDTSTGGLPVGADRIELDVAATARWATVNGLELTGAQLQVGQGERPCS